MAPQNGEPASYSRSVHVVVSSGGSPACGACLGFLPSLFLVGAGALLEVKVRLGVIEVHGAGQRLGIIGGPVAF